MGHIDEEMVPAAIQPRYGRCSTARAQPGPAAEAYRLLSSPPATTGNGAMPFLFEAIADYTELLMPDDLLSGNSILAYTCARP